MTKIWHAHCVANSLFLLPVLCVCVQKVTKTITYPQVKVEIVADTIDILAKSAALPFQVSTSLENESETQLPSDEVRLKYRYLDLRRPSDA